jgi:hypothetical protein
MVMRMVGFGLVALVCVFGAACSSDTKTGGTDSGSTTSSTAASSGPGATTPTTVDPNLGPDPCETLTVGELEDVFGAGVSDGVRTVKNPGWCTWTISGGAQLTFRYPGKGNEYNAKTANAVAALNAKRSTAGNTADAPGVGDAAYFLVVDSNLVVAKAPDTLFELHYEAGIPTNDAVLLPQLTTVAQKHLGQVPA